MRRGDFLSHVGWTGAGIAFALDAQGLFSPVAADAATGFSFVQISDSHIGFKLPANPDVTGTLQNAVARINALPVQPAFVVHTGDITHLSKVAEFDDAKQILSTLRAPVLTIPGEHDAIGAEGLVRYKAAFGRPQTPDLWYSWDHAGTHFVALVNVFNFETMGLLGQTQIDWLAKDLEPVKSDTPVVVFGHVPLYALYEPWGWTTEDGSKVLAMLRRFDAVTVLNGHIHQIIEHTDGKIRFRTAASTAFPQPAPGTAPAPGPMKDLPAGQLLSRLGYRTIAVDAAGKTQLTDTMLG